MILLKGFIAQDHISTQRAIVSHTMGGRLMTLVKILSAVISPTGNTPAHETVYPESRESTLRTIVTVIVP